MHEDSSKTCMSAKQHAGDSVEVLLIMENILAESLP